MDRRGAVTRAKQLATWLTVVIGYALYSGSMMDRRGAVSIEMTLSSNRAWELV